MHSRIYIYIYMICRKCAEIVTNGLLSFLALLYIPSSVSDAIAAWKKTPPKRRSITFFFWVTLRGLLSRSRLVCEWLYVRTYQKKDGICSRIHLHRSKATTSSRYRFRKVWLREIHPPLLEMDPRTPRSGGSISIVVSWERGSCGWRIGLFPVYDWAHVLQRLSHRAYDRDACHASCQVLRWSVTQE